ncbi:MAG: hypothetical protein WC606_02030 [Candidatus Absconditabacterales bacterium]
MSTILNQLNNFRANIVHIMANVSGRAEPEAEILLLVILGYIVLILLLLFIHRKLLRKQRRIHENLVVLYDTIRYQVARAQYGNPTIQDIKGITVVIQADHKNYVANAKAIKEEIVSIEQKFGQQIISADQRNAINKQAKKKNRFMIFVQLIGRLTTLLTVGIYKLFR